MPRKQPADRVILLGSGTCRIDPHRGPVSACVITGHTTYVIDLGAGALERLDLAGAFDTCHELHLHISHSHIDHVFGLFPLLQCLTWSDDARHLGIQRVIIHATDRVCEQIRQTQLLWDAMQTQLQSTYPGCEARTLAFQPGPDREDWHYNVGSLAVRSVHLPAHENHGVSFSLNGTTYAFTCDATEPGENLVAFCSGVDVCVFDLGHLSFTRQGDGRFALSLDTAARLLATANPRAAYATHVYLRHLQDRVLTPLERQSEIHQLVDELAIRAKALGFTGIVTVGEDGMVL